MEIFGKVGEGEEEKEQKKKTKKKIKTVEHAIQVKNDSLVYHDQAKFDRQFKQLKKDNPDQWGVITIEIVDKVAHRYYKYYWGTLLPELTQSIDIFDHLKLHKVLKQKFLMEDVKGSWEQNDIKERYSKHPIKACKQENWYDCFVPRGTNQILTRFDKPVNIIPTCKGLTTLQMEAFLKRCEFYTGDIVDLDIDKEKDLFEGE